MDNNRLKYEQTVLRDAAAAYVEGGPELLGRTFDFYNVVFENQFFGELRHQIEDAYYHMPKVPTKKDGSPDMGTDAYRIYVEMDTELYAIYRILQHDETPDELKEAYDEVYPYFNSSRWKMDQILDRFFAELDKT